MSIRELFGMKYDGFEVTLDVNHRPKELTRVLRKLLEDAPRAYLHSVSSAPDPFDEGRIVYTIVLAS